MKLVSIFWIYQSIQALSISKFSVSYTFGIFFTLKDNSGKQQNLDLTVLSLPVVSIITTCQTIYVVFNNFWKLSILLVLSLTHDLEFDVVWGQGHRSKVEKATTMILACSHVAGSIQLQGT